jgi:hypothetical protein
MQFRKKPVVVKAVEFNPTASPWHHDVLGEDFWPRGVRRTSYVEVAQLLGTSGCSKEPPYWDWSVLGILDTPRGPRVLCPGDWIVTNATGDQDACKPEIFEATYERVVE